MKRALNLLACILGTAVLFGCTTQATAADDADERAAIGTVGNLADVIEPDEPFAINEEIPAIQAVDYLPDITTEVPAYFSFTGTVTEIIPSETEEEVVTIVLEGEATESESESENPVIHFILSENTVNLTEDEIEEGMVLTGFYDTSLPMVMIYPPRHEAAVLAPVTERVLVDRFGSKDSHDFLSSTGNYSLSFNEDTVITFQDGTVFEGDVSELDGRAMVVFFDVIRETHPAGVLTNKIIVLFERAVHPTLELTEEELAELGESVSISTGGLQLTQEDLDMLWDNMFDPETVQVIINGEAIDTPAPFVDRENGTVMVSAAHIANALGYTTVGEGADLVIGRGITFTIGEDNYFFGRMAGRPLGAAPQLVDGNVFVPMHFFGEIIPSGSMIVDGNIVIESTEE